MSALITILYGVIVLSVYFLLSHVVRKILKRSILQWSIHFPIWWWPCWIENFTIETLLPNIRVSFDRFVLDIRWSQLFRILNECRRYRYVTLYGLNVYHGHFHFKDVLNPPKHRAKGKHAPVTPKRSHWILDYLTNRMRKYLRSNVVSRSESVHSRDQCNSCVEGS